MARVYETSVVLLLLTLLVLGMVWVASAIAGNGAVSRQSLYGGCWGWGGRWDSMGLNVLGGVQGPCCALTPPALLRPLGMLPALPLLLHLALWRAAPAA